MQGPDQFYSSELAIARKEISILKRQLIILGLLRLFVFILIFFPLFFNWNSVLTGTWISIFVVLFFYLISKYTDIRKTKDRQELKARLCQHELCAFEGDFSAFNSGKEYTDPHHSFAYDMDLFGAKSLFQSINRTGSKESEQMLADLLTKNSITGIQDKQNVIRELSGKPDWCLNFRTRHNFYSTEINQAAIVTVMKGHVQTLPDASRIITIVFSAVSVSLTALVIAGIFNWQILLFPFFAGLLITGIFVSKVSKISQRSTSLSNSFRLFSESLEMIESEKWNTPELKSRSGIADVKENLNSKRFLAFSKILSGLDQRNNVFFAIVANGFFLWDLNYGSRAEKWILENASKTENAFFSLNYFDVQVSLAMYSFMHPGFVFPNVLTSEKFSVSAVNCGHPLIPDKKNKRNSFRIQDRQFFVITGANMAGKSTFLRTAGVSVLMANAGLPVNAHEFDYTPVKLISSMRSSDSLINDESYFFAELKRLKFIVDALDGENYFIILDEILKGTNSKDKEEGSRKFLERLSQTGSAGLIATHDLSLCDLSKNNESIINYYFDAEIVNDELVFDYTLKSGICQNMNASFLLRKMKIVD